MPGPILRALKNAVILIAIVIPTLFLRKIRYREGDYIDQIGPAN